VWGTDIPWVHWVAKTLLGATCQLPLSDVSSWAGQGEPAEADRPRSAMGPRPDYSWLGCDHIEDVHFSRTRHPQTLEIARSEGAGFSSG
jgi:hypothetical protein